MLDVGAGSGDVAAFGFPDLPAFLLDVDPYEVSNPKHERVEGDFMELDLGKLRPQTILFCHSLYNFWDDVERLRWQLRSSGASTALVVTNEQTQTLTEMVAGLEKLGVPANTPWYVPLPGLPSERVARFSTELVCADFGTLARHVAHVLLNLPVGGASVELVARHLKSVLPQARLEIEQAIYCYRLQT